MNSPKWLDRVLYPFAHHQFSVANGNMHYIDEGEGDPILFIHGTPTWSFVWRQQIKPLSRNYRCIAPDHLGFGLSDKPAEFSYTPEAHAKNLEQLIDYLQLKNITLVVHDYGGPIGLKYALDHPENVKRLVILNTWMWSLENESKIIKASSFMRGGIGKLLYTKLNFSPRILLPKGYYNSSNLTKDTHRHYLKPFSSPSDRFGAWRFAVELQNSNSFYKRLWEQREKLQAIPKLIIWGEKDKLLPIHFLDKWQKAFPDAKTVRLKAGHFLQEEKGSEIADLIKELLK